jgi:hypothetical protein
MEISMKNGFFLRQWSYLVLSLLMASASAQCRAGDTATSEIPQSKTQSVANSTINREHISEINRDYLAVGALLDTKNQFEAILYNHQSQETIGHLFWDQTNSTGSIEFEYAGVKDTIDLQIPENETLDSSERYNTLLDGLREAGIAWVSQYSSDTYEPSPANSSETAQPLEAASENRLPIGSFDSISPEQAIGYKHLMYKMTRQAAGWAHNPDYPSYPIWVHLYARATQGSRPYRYIAAIRTGTHRPDANIAKDILEKSGWRATVPEAWDADYVNDSYDVCKVTTIQKPAFHYSVFCSVDFIAYAIDSAGERKLLANGPKRITYSSRTR